MTDIYQKVEKVRKPRIHIKYELETEGGKVSKELPFVFGIMGDFIGNAGGQHIPDFSHREFIDIDIDNFDGVMQKLSPALRFNVENSLSQNEDTLPISLQFNAITDFLPERIIEQVPALQKLRLARDRLRELATKVDCSEDIEAAVKQLLEKTLMH